MRYVLFESYACIPPTTTIRDSEHIPVLYTEIEKRIKTLKQRNWNSILELFQILLLGVSWSTLFFILSMHIEVLNICSLGLVSCTNFFYLFKGRISLFHNHSTNRNSSLFSEATKPIRTSMCQMCQCMATFTQGPSIVSQSLAKRQPLISYCIETATADFLIYSI
jgi:hypothetical protein